MTVIARPGKNAIHQAWLNSSWPEASIAPQLVRGGAMPRPRKDSALSTRMAVPTCRVASATIVPARLGSTWRNTTRVSEAPAARRPSTNWRSRIVMVADRVTRAQAAQPVRPSTRKSTGRDAPRLAMIASATRMNGSASWASIRIETTLSTQPRQ